MNRGIGWRNRNCWMTELGHAKQFRTLFISDVHLGSRAAKAEFLIDFLRHHDSEFVIVLAGDHVYKMDYARLLQFHVDRGAQCTVGCIEVPRMDATAFGVMHIDRSHRIGQLNNVFAYRLIAPGTVEEKIWDLQQRKSQTISDVLGEEGFARNLSKSDLEYLFSED